MSLSTRNGLLGSPGFGLRGNVVPLRKKKYPMCLYDGNTVAWYDYTDLSTITKSATDYVSKWADKLGSGHDLLQANSNYQPKWYESDGVLFDGSNDYLKTTSFTYIQPEMLYLVFNQITSTAADYVFDGYNSLSGSLRQAYTGAKGLQARAPNLSLINTDLNLNEFGILRVVFNLWPSKLQVNNNTATIFTSLSGTDMNGFTLGNIGASGFASNIQVKEAILRKVADNSIDETAIYNYLATKHGFTLI